MIDKNYQDLWKVLPEWEQLFPRLRERLQTNGNFPRWCEAVENLPVLDVPELLMQDTVSVRGQISDAERRAACDELRKLMPWRKGPFEIFGINIETEWRSDYKWNRVSPHIDIRGHRVMDIGSGNGYFGWRMLDAGARFVVGIEPMVLFCAQHFALNKYFQSDKNWVVPIRFEHIEPELTEAQFDTVFSMGVLYHQKAPMDHLKAIRRCLAPGGQAVIESLIVQEGETLYPTERYAKMRNVWNVPNLDDLCSWLKQSGFTKVEVVDVNVTSMAEQRRTEWMVFESLADFLDPTDETKTLEGYPAPTRGTIVASCD